MSSNIPDAPLDLAARVGAAERSILVSGLQALWRERTAAFNCAADVAAQRGQPAPDSAAFGIDEVDAMLRRVGASAYKF